MKSKLVRMGRKDFMKLKGKVPDNRYAEGLASDPSPEMAKLIGGVMTGALPCHARIVAFADLVVEDPAVLAGARHVVAENPSVKEMMREARAKGDAWAVYRGDDGNLVMFDNYHGYVVAEIDKVERVLVLVYGEAAPDIEP